ncbi:MAG: 30S ribosomal protein S20 [Tissierellia bacterium]|nr:30S ribosomal protein S20 [Tissierellia bacterium]
MANIKSAIKRIDVAKKNTARNRIVKTEVKTVIRKFKELVEAGEKDKAKDLLKLVDKKLKRAVKTGVMHKNKASRTLSQMAKMLNK